MMKLKHFKRKIIARLSGSGKNVSVEYDKYEGETSFWKDLIKEIEMWYRGDLPVLYGNASPLLHERVLASSEKDSAILTYRKLHQEVKYLHDLKVESNQFIGKKILDIGAGPIPSATCFLDAEIYHLDPLLYAYLKIGYPAHYYPTVRFVQARSEGIPLPDNFFDVIISVNALDHVDDFEITAKEIIRVLKPDGKVIFHLHYHKPEMNEPIELNDERVMNAFSSVSGFRKTAESREKYGYKCQEGEKYVLWTNL